MSTRKVKAIFFDAAGTLFTVNGSVGAIYANLAREYGKDVAVADLEAGFRRYFAAAPPMAFPGAAPTQIPTLEKQWWKTLVQNVFSALGSFPRFDEYFTALFEFFAQAEAWKLYPETIETLERLQERELTLGVISNFDSRLFGLLDGLGVAQFFDPVIISTQVGAAKPEVTIFSQALSQTGLQASEAIHIGDSYDADIIGAQAAGLTPVFVNRQSRSQGTTGYFEINNLTSVFAIIEEL
jgi:putative hydrolase of the HAD superfamily